MTKKSGQKKDIDKDAETASVKQTKKTGAKNKIKPLADTPISTNPRLEILKQLRIVIRAAQQHSLWIEKQCGVNGAQLWIIQELHESNGLRVGELARRLAIHQTTTSNLLDGLDKRGYIIKTRDPDDQRAVVVNLTDSGIKLLMTAPKPARGLLPEALLQMDDSCLQDLNSGLKGLLNSIDILDEGFELLPLPFTM